MQILLAKLPPPCPRHYWVPTRQVITYITLRRLVHRNLRGTKQCYTRKHDNSQSARLDRLKKTLIVTNQANATSPWISLNLHSHCNLKTSCTYQLHYFIFICNHRLFHPIYVHCINRSSYIKPVTGPLSQILFDKLPPPCPSQYWLPARQVITYIIMRRLVHNNLRDTKQCFTSIPWLDCNIFTVVLPWYSVFLKLWASQCFPTTNHS